MVPIALSASMRPHCVECLHEMGKLLLNLVPIEPLALMQELANFDNLIYLEILLASVLDLCVHDLINCGLLYPIWV